MALMMTVLYFSFISEREIRSHILKKVILQNFLIKFVYINVLISIIAEFNGKEGEALISYFSREFSFILVTISPFPVSILNHSSSLILCNF